MAYAEIKVNNERTGQIRTAPIGFSWTVFFFGFFVPLIRGDWIWGIVMVILFPLGWFTLIATGGAGGIIWLAIALIFANLYNNIYLKNLLNNGFIIKEISDKDLELIEKKNPKLFS